MAAQKALIGNSSPLMVSHGQMKELHRQLEDGSLNGIHIQRLLRHENPFDLENIVIDWRMVYDRLGMKVDFNNEDANDPNYWVVPVFTGVTPNRVIKIFRELGVNLYLYSNDLDKSVIENDRDPVRDGDYRVKFAKTIEADPELKNKSAEVLKEEGIKGITLLERLLLELGYFLTTGNHLDVENVTLCSGSRYSGGRVPRVHWSAGLRGLYVDWCNPSGSDSRLRARAVVS